MTIMFTVYLYRILSMRLMLEELGIYPSPRYSHGKAVLKTGSALSSFGKAPSARRPALRRKFFLKGRPMKSFAIKSRPGMANTLVTVIDMDGELNVSTTPEFEAKIEELFSQRRFKIVLNMKELIYVSSNGFGALVGNLREAKNNKGDIKLANVSQEILEVLQMMEFHQIFQIFNHEDAAVRAF